MEQHEPPVSLKPFTRRQFLTAATASVSVLALSACGGGEEGSAAAEAMLEDSDGTKSAERIRGRWKRDTKAPTTPSSISAAAVSSSSIRVTWTASTDDVKVSHYRLYRCAGDACAPSQQIATVTSTNYTDSGLAAGTPYSYTVVAVDGAGNVSASSPITTAATFAAAVAPSVDTTAPSAPIGLTATVASSSSVTLRWNASTDDVGVAGYIVYRCTGSGCTSLTEISRTTTTSYTDSALSAGTSYSYSVAAIDTAGNVSARSGLATAMTNPVTAPVTWEVNPAPLLVAGSSNTFDLSATLPQGVVRGGLFSLDASSAPLPSGVTLTSSGLLSASAGTSGTFSGVIFAYREPA